MAKKYKYYLVRSEKDGFLYARGLPFAEESINGLALVRTDLYKDLDFKGDWVLIDIASGLFIWTSYSKKRILEHWTQISGELIPAIIEARKTEGYIHKRIPEMKAEKEVWRKLGYSVED